MHYNNRLTSNMGGGNSRIVWIDLLKGFTILGVIWVHAGGHPDWLTSSTVNTLFFFMAGMFFKRRPFTEFIKKHTVSLLIPFILFYLLSYPFRIIVELWDHRSLDAVTWNMIYDIFKTEARADYLYVNVPLWFILCLFWVQIYYWLISKIPLWGKLVIFTMIFLTWDTLSAIHSPLMINNALCWLLYFGIGQVLGEQIIKLVKNKRKAICVLTIAILAMLISHYASESQPIIIIFYLSWCITMVILFSFLNNVRFLQWLEFFGLNSLVILGSHLWFLTPIMRLFYKLNNGNDIATSIIGTSICALLLIPLIIFINRYMPVLAGKKHKHETLFYRTTL